MPKLFTNCELQMNNSNPSKYQQSDVVYKILLLDWGHLYIIKIKRISKPRVITISKNKLFLIRKVGFKPVV